MEAIRLEKLKVIMLKVPLIDEVGVTDWEDVVSPLVYLTVNEHPVVDVNTMNEGKLNVIYPLALNLVVTI